MVNLLDLIEDRFGEAPMVELGDQSIVAIFEEIVSDAPQSYSHSEARQVFMVAFLAYSGNLDPSGDLGMIPGGWKVNVSNNLMKTSLVAATLTGLLHMAGLSDLSGYVLPTVLPLLLEIEKIKLSKGEEYILAELRLSRAFSNHRMFPKEFYGKLDDSLKQEISLPDFMDLLEKLHLSGDASLKFDMYRINARTQLKITYY